MVLDAHRANKGAQEEDQGGFKVIWRWKEVDYLMEHLVTPKYDGLWLKNQISGV